MSTKTASIRPDRSLARTQGKLRAWFSKPANVILLLFCVVLVMLTLYPLVSMLSEMFLVHSSERTMVRKQGLKVGDFTTIHFEKLLFTLDDGIGGDITTSNSWINFYQPLLNTLLISVAASCIAIVFGGLVAFLITRTNISCKKFISGVFVFPYIMPSWTLATFWQSFFKNTEIGLRTSNGIMASVFGVFMPEWFVYGPFPIALVLGLHYAPFAYILIGGILRNMDANLEEAATILKTRRGRIIRKITLPIVRPAMLSTLLLVFASSMSAYSVPVFLGDPVRYYTLSTKMKSMMDKYPGQAYIMVAVMIIFGVGILLINQKVTNSRKQFTTVTGKSSQISLINLRRANRPVAILLVVVLPLSRVLVGTTVGTRAFIVPLAIAAFPFVARLVETSIREVDKGVVEAALAMGASPWQIVYKVLIPEAKPALISNFMVALITIFGYGAMSGVLGGGGLGALAINYGYYRRRTLVMYFTVILLIVLVQIFQSTGNAISKKSDKRIR